MISNYHTASSNPGSTYYTFGFDDDANVQSAAKATAKKTGRRGMRGFKGWGRGGRNAPSNETVSESSQATQSLANSGGSSVQSTGESTASTDFSGMRRLLEEAGDSKDPVKARYYPRGPGSVSSSLNYSDSETSTIGRSKLSRGTSVNSNLSTDYSTDQESQLEGTKLISVLLDEPTHKPLQSALGPTDFSSDEEDDHHFDLRFEAARTPKHRRGNKKVAPEIDRSESKGSFSGTNGPSVTSNEKQTHSIATKRSTAAASVSTTKTSPQPQQQQQQQPPPPPPPQKEKVQNQVQVHVQRQPQSEPTAATKVNQSKSQAKSKRFSSCGLEVIEDSIPTNVKTFLRPFLCGVI